MHYDPKMPKSGLHPMQQPDQLEQPQQLEQQPQQLLPEKRPSVWRTADGAQQLADLATEEMSSSEKQSCGTSATAAASPH